MHKLKKETYYETAYERLVLTIEILIINLGKLKLTEIEELVKILENRKQVAINGFETTIILNLEVDYIKAGLQEINTLKT